MNMFPAIRFSYQNDDYSLAREIVCRKLTEAVSTVIPLPKEIVIRIANLGPSTHGSTAVEFRFRNRVTINSTLSLEEIPEVLVHELIHINQLHTGVLKASRIGTYYWNGQPYKINVNTMTFEQHQQLPWEVDVLARHEGVLSEALVYAMKR